MPDLAEWKQQLEGIRTGLGDWAAAPEGERAARVAAVFAGAKNWDSHFAVFAAGQLDPAPLVEACRAGLMLWWQPLAGKAFFGDAGGMRAIKSALDADCGKSEAAVDFSATMTWAAWPDSFIDGLAPRLDAAALRQAFDWGADPGYEKGNYFDKTLRRAPAANIRVFLDHGASPVTAANVAAELLGAGNVEQALCVQEALDMGGFYAKVDGHTLMETKYIRTPDCHAQLRTVFNFRAGRVTEIFERAQAAPAMTGYAFADYDQAALNVAREKLLKLGGRPDDLPAALGKPRRGLLKPA